MSVGTILFIIALLALTAEVIYRAIKNSNERKRIEKKYWDTHQENLKHELGHTTKDLIIKLKVKEKWTPEELLVASFIAVNYKMTNTELIEEVALLLQRPKSAFIRKLNRLRACVKETAKFASDDDDTYACYMDRLTEMDGRITFFDALVCMDASILELEELLNSSVRLKVAQ